MSFRGTLCVVCTRDVSSRTPCMFLLLHGEEFYHWVGCHDRLIHSEVWKIGSKQAWRPDLHFMFTWEGERWAVVTHDGGKMHWEAKHTLGVKKGREAGRQGGILAFVIPGSRTWYGGAVCCMDGAVQVYRGRMGGDGQGGGGGSVVEKTMMTSWCVGWGGEIRPIFHDCCSS